MATITLAVTVVNVGGANYYFIDGSQQAGISAIPGNTYKFDQADSSNSGHPLRLSITSNGTHAGGSAYTDGVTTSGTPGNAGAYTQIVVDATTVQTLYYYCTQHSNMGGPFNVGSSSTVRLKNIKGFTVQNLAADPLPLAQAQAADPYAGTWSSGGALNTARSNNSGLGSQSAAVAVGGSGTPNAVELYNGTSWSEIAEINTGRQYTASGGTSTAGITFGGYPSTAVTEIYNGSAWTEVADLTTGRSGLGGCGTTTSALAFGGISKTAKTETWDGTSWAEVADLNTARIE